MAELSNSGTYVKLVTHVWYDKKANNVHVTSNDKDLPPGNLHMTAKKGTQSDKNLRILLDNFGCGEKAAKLKTTVDPLTGISERIDELINNIENGDGQDLAYVKLLEMRTLADSLLPEPQ